MVAYRTLDKDYEDNSRLTEEHFSLESRLLGTEAQIAQYEAMLKETDRPDEKNSYSSQLDRLKEELKGVQKRLKALKGMGIDPPENLSERLKTQVEQTLNVYERQHAQLVPYVKYVKETSDQADVVHSEVMSLVGTEAMIKYYQSQLS